MLGFSPKQFFAIILSLILLSTGIPNVQCISISLQNWNWDAGTDRSYSSGTHTGKGGFSTNNHPGGLGHALDSNFGWSNVVWEYRPSSREFGFIHGSFMIDSKSDASPSTTYDAACLPGGGQGQVFQITESEWLYFLQLGCNSQDCLDHWQCTGCIADRFAYMTQIWMYNVDDNQFRFVFGVDELTPTEVKFHTRNVFDSSNLPAPRMGFGGVFLDKRNQVFYFGGEWGKGANSEDLNDVWLYGVVENAFAWVFASGSPTSYSGTSQFPGKRVFPECFGSNDQVFCFGGEGRDVNSQVGILADLWNYNVTLEEWTFIMGSDTHSFQGSSNRYESFHADNLPAAKSMFSSSIVCSNLFVFSAGSTYSDRSNEIWAFDTDANLWRYVYGEKTGSTELYGDYGTIGVPSTITVPGSRLAHSSMVLRTSETNFELFFFGGDGYIDASVRSLDTDMSDLWIFRFNGECSQASSCPEPNFQPPACTFCVDGFELIDTDCIQSCQNQNFLPPACTICKDGFELVVDQCLVPCAEENFLPPACTACKDGFELVVDQCLVPCVEENFLPPACTTCKTGFELVVDECLVPCMEDNFLPPDCIECKNGFELSVDGCLVPCVEENFRPPECTLCKDGFELVVGTSECHVPCPKDNFLPPACTACKDGYEISGSDCVSICPKENFQPPSCTSCISGFELDNASGELCLASCLQSENFLPPECIVCKDGFELIGAECFSPCVDKENFLPPECTVCKDGYERIGSSDCLLACGEQNFLPPDCIICQEGFEKLDSNTCVLSCESDNFLPPECTSCKDGYELIDSGCTTSNDDNNNDNDDDDDKGQTKKAVDNTNRLIGIGVGVAGVIVVFLCILKKLVKKLKVLNKINVDELEIIVQEKELESSNTPIIKMDQSRFIVDPNSIKLLKNIGAGAGGNVYKAEWKGNIVAFKQFKYGAVVQNSEFDISGFEKELQFANNIRHPYVAAFFGCCIDPSRTGIIMEYASNGDIMNYILREKQKGDGSSVPVAKKFDILAKCANALSYLHANSIIHRVCYCGSFSTDDDEQDVKCSNILLNESLDPKIIDFGLSKEHFRENDLNTRKVGTGRYLAPEMILGKKYTLKVDVFSFSIVMYEMYFETEKPYGDISMIDSKIANGLRPPIDEMDTPAEHGWFVDLTKRCWAQRSEERPDFIEIEKMFNERNISKGKES